MKIGSNPPKNSLDLIRIICKEQLHLKDDHVSIYDQKWVIPDFDDMFLTIEYRNSRMIANRNIFDDSGSTPVEWQELNMLENIIVGVFSRTMEAFDRKEEVLMAIKSQFAQFLQEAYMFKIARAGEILDLSYLEGTAMLKRYDIELMVYTWYERKLTTNAMIPPCNIQVIANDKGSGEIIEFVTASLQQPPL
jgi:hypothetical protein